MKLFGIILLLSAGFCLPAAAAPLSNNARTVIPQDVQQIISVDYRGLRDSAVARALKDQVIPDSIKQFESSCAVSASIPSATPSRSPSSSYRGQKKSFTASASRKDRSGRKSSWSRQKPGS